MEKKRRRVIVIGAGPAGLSAAIYLKRAGFEVLVLEKEELGGQIRISNVVVNYPGIEKMSGENFAKTLYRQALSFGTVIRQETVESIEVTDGKKTVKTTKESYSCEILVYAAGTKPRRLHFPGEEKFMGRGISLCATCDGELFIGKKIFVIGGGYAAAEEAIYLTRYSKPITMIIREPDFTCAKELADQVKAHPQIETVFHTQIKKVEGTYFMEQITFENTEENKTWEYRSREPVGVFIFAGYVPNSSMLKEIVCCDENGYLLIDKAGRTNVKGIYGAGDVCHKTLRQLVSAACDGAQAAETIGRDYPLEEEK